MRSATCNSHSEEVNSDKLESELWPKINQNNGERQPKSKSKTTDSTIRGNSPNHVSCHWLFPTLRSFLTNSLVVLNTSKLGQNQMVTSLAKKVVEYSFLLGVEIHSIKSAVIPKVFHKRVLKRDTAFEFEMNPLMVRLRCKSSNIPTRSLGTT